MKPTIFSLLIISAHLLLMACQPSGPRGNRVRPPLSSLWDEVEKSIRGRSSQASECFEIQSGILMAYHCEDSHVVIPDEVLAIDRGVFYGRGLESVLFPPTVVYIGEAAFSSNQIESVSLPNVIHIMDEAFSGNKLSSVEVPEVTFIGPSAFAYNYLSSVELPEVTFIGAGAFQGNQISSVLMPQVTSIGDLAFYSNQLSFVELPCFVKMGQDVFFDNDYEFEHSLCL